MFDTEAIEFFVIKNKITYNRVAKKLEESWKFLEFDNLGLKTCKNLEFDKLKKKTWHFEQNH